MLRSPPNPTELISHPLQVPAHNWIDGPVMGGGALEVGGCYVLFGKIEGSVLLFLPPHCDSGRNRLPEQHDVCSR